MEALEVPRSLDIRVKTVTSGIEVRSGRNPLLLGLCTPLGAPFLFLTMFFFDYCGEQTWAIVVPLALYLFLLTRQESLLLRPDGRLRWTRYWGSTVEFTAEEIKATVLRKGRLYLAGNRGLYWVVGSTSMTWLGQLLESWAEGPDDVEIAYPAPPKLSFGFKPWEVWVVGAAYLCGMGPAPMLYYEYFAGAQPAETDFWNHVLLTTALALAAAPSLGAVAKWAAFRAAGESKPFKSFYRLGILCDGVSLAVFFVTLCMAAFVFNITDDSTTEKLTIPIVSSFHLSGEGGNGSAQDVYVLEFAFPPYIQREPIACPGNTRLKTGDVVEGTSGKGRLGCRWYRLPDWVQNSLVNRGEVYQSGLENQSFGHLSLQNAMNQGKVHAHGHFAPHSPSLSLLRSYNVPIDEETPAKQGK